ncbi:MAG TPA: rhomboid family intramembrane serine protease [Afifellaceae bacterium]|nr:rhomboid family intramembrane serine protease [Afifellaceae bacterium]
MFIPLHDDNPLANLTRPWVNYGLIAFTVLAFFVAGGVNPDAVRQSAFSFGLIPSVVNDIRELPADYVLVPEAATFVTYAFLHASFLHLAGNMLFLWVFGDNIEDAVGHLRYLAFYLLSAAGGGLAHSLFNADSTLPLIGASGAVAGIVGAYLLLHPRVKLWVLLLGKIPFRLSAVYILLAWAAFQVVNLFIAVPGEENVAWWAHIGGFIAGCLLIVVMRRPGVVLLDRNIAPHLKA